MQGSKQTGLLPSLVALIIQQTLSHDLPLVRSSNWKIEETRLKASWNRIVSKNCQYYLWKLSYFLWKAGECLRVIQFWLLSMWMKFYGVHSNDLFSSYSHSAFRCKKWSLGFFFFFFVSFLLFFIVYFSFLFAVWSLLRMKGLIPICPEKFTMPPGEKPLSALQIFAFSSNQLFQKSRLIAAGRKQHRSDSSSPPLLLLGHLSRWTFWCLFRHLVLAWHASEYLTFRPRAVLRSCKSN